MAKIFSITEHRLIRSLLAAKTDDQLADMVGCSKEEMTSYISKLTGVPKRIEAKAPKPSKAAKEISLKKLQRRAQKVRKEKEVKAKAVRVNRDHERQQRRKSESRSTFKTIPFNTAGKISVQLNAKTQAWVLPGTDIEALKKKLRIS